jgi:hypothetical protein
LSNERAALVPGDLLAAVGPATAVGFFATGTFFAVVAVATGGFFAAAVACMPYVTPSLGSPAIRAGDSGDAHVSAFGRKN